MHIFHREHKDQLDGNDGVVDFNGYCMRNGGDVRGVYSDYRCRQDGLICRAFIDLQ